MMILLSKAIFKNVRKRKSTIALFLLSFTPWIIAIVKRLDTNFMQISGEGVTLIDFFDIMFSTQQGLVIPIILLTYISVTLLYDEIKDGQIYFYKDINRKKVLNAKYMTMYKIYAIYIIMFIINLSLVYFIALKNDPLFTGEVFSKAPYISLFCIIICIISDFLIINIGMMIALRLNAGYTILITLFTYILSLTSAHLKELSLFFPNGALFRVNDVSNGVDLIRKLMIPILMVIVYSIILYVVNVKKINRMDF